MFLHKSLFAVVITVRMIQTSFAIDSLLQNMWEGNVQENIWLLKLTILLEGKFVIRKGLPADKAVYIFIHNILLTMKLTLVGYFVILLKHLLVWIMTYYVPCKLNYCGIWDMAGQWFKLYPKVRKQDWNKDIILNCDIFKNGVLQGWILGLSLFLPPAVNSQSKPMLFAGDTDILIYHPERASFRNVVINDIFDKMNK